MLTHREMEITPLGRENDLSFWKNLILVAIFFTLAPVTIGVSIFSLFSLKESAIQKDSFETSVLTSPKSGVRVYASLPINFPTVDGTVEGKDARAELLREYMDYYNSPLAPFAEYLVQVSDKYTLDYRLLTAIAQQESNLCKIIPPNSYNCWGWGIHSEGTLGFASYEEAIDAVAKGLREEYLDKGYTSIDEIMSKYTPQSNGSWANGVKEFLTAIE